MPQLPDATAFAEFSRLVMLIIGTVLALFGLGLYHGALRLFGSLVGGSCGLLLYFANRAILPEFTFSGVVFPILFAFFGGVIGSWLAAFAHYVLFFLIGCITGWLAIHAQAGHISFAGSTQNDWKAVPDLNAIQMIGVALFGVIYLAAANWMLTITTAILGATMVSSVMDNRMVLYIGAPLGILVQYALFLRHEEYRDHRRAHRADRERDDEARRNPTVIYDRGTDQDDL